VVWDVGDSPPQRQLPMAMAPMLPGRWESTQRSGGCYTEVPDEGGLKRRLLLCLSESLLML